MFMKKHGIPGIQQLIEAFKFDQEHRLTWHYADISDAYDDIQCLELVIAIDTVFLLELLIENDRAVKDGWSSMWSDIESMNRDSLLLGNQIPIKFLLKLYKLYPTTLTSNMNQVIRNFINWRTPFFILEKNIQQIFDGEDAFERSIGLTLLECVYLSSITDLRHIPNETRDDCMDCRKFILEACGNIHFRRRQENTWSIVFFFTEQPTMFQPRSI